MLRSSLPVGIMLIALAVPLPATEALPAPAGPLPASPSEVPGGAIPIPPAITHWPAITFPDERGSIALRIPRPGPPTAGTVAGTVAWRGGEPLPVVLTRLAQTGCLLPLDAARPGSPWVELRLPAVPPTDLPFRLASAADPWPQSALRDGNPVDDQGVPVALIDRRRNGQAERHLTLVAALRSDRGDGGALVVAAPQAWAGATLWEGLPARLAPVDDVRFPGHAALVALARDQASWGGHPPRTILLAPGPRIQAEPDDERCEERLLAALRTRCEALGTWPRLVLLLPPAPLSAMDRERETIRRDRLRQAGQDNGWVVLDPERLAGPATEANRLGEGAWAAVPVGPGRERLRIALGDELRR